MILSTFNQKIRSELVIRIAATKSILDNRNLKNPGLVDKIDPKYKDVIDMDENNPN